VEQQRCEHDQVKALRVIFKLVQHDVQLLREFIQCDGYAMIVKVCMTNRCIVGHELVKVSNFAHLFIAFLKKLYLLHFTL